MKKEREKKRTECFFCVRDNIYNDVFTCDYFTEFAYCPCNRACQYFITRNDALTFLKSFVRTGFNCSQNNEI